MIPLIFQAKVGQRPQGFEVRKKRVTTCKNESTLLKSILMIEG